MQEQGAGEFLISLISDSFVRLYHYVPQFFVGLVILLFGLLAASIVKKTIIGLFKLGRFDRLLSKAQISDAKSVNVWTGIIAELFRWTTVILFLIPAVETWGIPRVTTVLNQLLFYIPNVFVAVIVGLVGFVIAKLAYDVIYHGSEGLGSDQAKLLAALSRYAILFFAGLIVLNQLGIASDLIRILFTGIVAMLALAGGLAFGLGGKDLAAEILRELKKKIAK